MAAEFGASQVDALLAERYGIERLFSLRRMSAEEERQLRTLSSPAPPARRWRHEPTSKQSSRSRRLAGV